MGTPLYLAPEMIEGKEYNAKGDIWSLGVILFELIALHPPFTAPVMPALVMKICSSPVPPVPSHASEELRGLTSTLLVKDPSLRPRIHEVLAHPFIHNRIDRFLPAEALVAEFAHTVLHSGGRVEEEATTPPPRLSKGAANPAPNPNLPGRQRAKQPVRKSTPPRVRGRQGGEVGGGEREREGKPGEGREGRDEEELAKVLQRREADERRESMRRQIRQDRTQGVGGKQPFSVEILVGAPPPSRGASCGLEQALGRVGGGREGGGREEEEERRAVPRSKSEGSSLPEKQDTLPAEDAMRRALETANPGSRLLSAAERREVEASQHRRREEVMGGVLESDAKGEAGRDLVNRAQRELLRISRVLGALEKRYVLMRPGCEANPEVEEAVGASGVERGEVGLLGGESEKEEVDWEEDGGVLERDDPFDPVPFEACEVGVVKQPALQYAHVETASLRDEPAPPSLRPASVEPYLNHRAHPQPHPQPKPQPHPNPPLRAASFEPLASEASSHAKSPGCEHTSITTERRAGGIAFDISFDQQSTRHSTASSRASLALEPSRQPFFPLPCAHPSRHMCFAPALSLPSSFSLSPWPVPSPSHSHSP